MIPDAGYDGLPDLSRRDALALFGVGGVAIPGLTAAFTPERIVGDPRAEGTPASIERTIPEDGIEYRSESDTVKWSKTSDQSGPYVTEAFEKWANRKAASVGSDAVLPAIQNRVEKEVTGIQKGASGELIGMVITVAIGTSYNRDGEVVSEPNISIDELVDVAPRSVRTTIRLTDREYERAVPVFVNDEEMDVHAL